MQINDPDVVAEIEAVLARYETALVERDVETLGDCFWNDPRVVRFGTHENLYGHAAVLISPLWARVRNGCASFHIGKVLVE